MASPDRRLTRISAVAASLLIALSACGSDESSDDPAEASAEASAATVTVEDPWSRRPVAGQSSSAVYGTLTNTGDDDVRVVAARTPTTDTAELHEVVSNDDGTMTMQERDGGFEIPAGASIVLEPGSFHIMLLAIDPETYPDTVAVDLELDDGSVVSLSAPVRETTDAMDMDEIDGMSDDG